MFHRSLSTLLKRIVAPVMLLAAFSATAVGAQTTGPFTYQGKLSVSGSPANSNYDFEFKLFDSLTSGTQQGGTVTLTNIAVSNGAFTVCNSILARPFRRYRLIAGGVRCRPRWRVASSTSSESFVLLRGPATD